MEINVDGDFFDIYAIRRPDIEDQDEAQGLDGLECATPTLEEHDVTKVIECLQRNVEKACASGLPEEWGVASFDQMGRPRSGRKLLGGCCRHLQRYAGGI